MSKAVKLSKRDETLLGKLDYNRDSEVKETIKNPFSGGTADLSPREVALYDYILGCERLALYDEMQKSLTLFRKLNMDAYFTLLD